MAMHIMAYIGLKEKPDEAVLQAIKERLSYDRTSGILIWSAPPKYSKMKKGDIAGTSNKINGYVAISVGIDGVCYKVKGHHIAWYLFYGEWPSQLIDHKDRNRSNNRILNLRLATDSKNCQNRSVRKDNKTGVTGISWSNLGNCYRVNITKSGNTISVGSFSSFEEAKIARLNAEQFYFGEFAPSILSEKLHAIRQPEKRVRRDNEIGCTGVYWHKQSRKWRSEISINGVRKFLGAFSTTEEAREARLIAEKQLTRR